MSRSTTPTSEATAARSINGVVEPGAADVPASFPAYANSRPASNRFRMAWRSSRERYSSTAPARVLFRRDVATRVPSSSRA
jgi:hypothetical protein